MADKNNQFTYKDAGVDIVLGDECSKILYEASRITWNNRSDALGKILSKSSSFSTLRYVELPEHKNLIMGLNSDGVGTKIELAERLNEHRTIAFDLFAMVCDDAAVKGAEPILLASVLDFESINIEVVKQLAEGMVKAAKQTKVCVINGEIAELGDRVSGYGKSNYNWSATLFWAAKNTRTSKHNILGPGTKILAVKENGIRANGISLLRKIMEKTYGKDWHNTSEGIKIAKWALLPSIIYSPLLVTLHGGYSHAPTAEIFGAVNITGGGIPGKLGRLLTQSKVGAKLDNLFDPPKEILQLQNIGSVSDKESYKTWNMGQGLLILCNETEQIVSLSNEMGYTTQVAGIITDKPGITIKSKAAKQHGELLEF